MQPLEAAYHPALLAHFGGPRGAAATLSLSAHAACHPEHHYRAVVLALLAVCGFPGMLLDRTHDVCGNMARCVARSRFNGGRDPGCGP